MKLTRVKDYLDQLQEIYPDVSKKDLKKIMDYGLRIMFKYVAQGRHVYLYSPKLLWLYVGKLAKDPIRAFEIYKQQLIHKIRDYYVGHRIPYFGYYYFALYQEEYDEIFNKPKGRGRPPKYTNFGVRSLYKLEDECRLDNSARTLIFRTPYPVDIGFKVTKYPLLLDKFKLIRVQEVITFQDVLQENIHKLCLNSQKILLKKECHQM